MRQLESNLPYFTYHPKSLKPVKAVSQQLPGNTRAEDISNELATLGFSVFSVR